MVRGEALDRLRNEERWDVIIVGGGATGLGAAVEAAARGYRTLLLEAFDFAKGTSSRSTKLVHGGVRYLEQGNVPLVREALHERGLLLKNASHLAHPLAFVVPVYSWFRAFYYGIGMQVYDLLSGKLSIGRSRPLSYGDTIRRVPTLERNGLVGGILYYDGQFDDTRLAISLLLTFLDHGGLAVNYMPATGLIKDGRGRVSGVQARDAETGEEFEIKGRSVVNATGVFADSLRKMDEPDARSMLAPSQGIHLVLPREFLPGDSAIMIPKTDDGRVLFAIPWHDRALIGTTDTPVKEASIEPVPLEQEVQFVLDHAVRYLNKDPQRSDVLSMFAGLRPLVKAGDAASTAALSRDHTLLVSPSGLVTITGGKWTTYRRMGEDTINKAAQAADLPKRPSTTRELKLHGWVEQPEPEPMNVYGADAPAVRALLAERPEWNELLHPRLPYRAGEVIWAARHELARTVEDVLSRRTRALLLDARASLQAAPRVAALLADELGFDEAWQQEQLREFRAVAEGYILV
jgi:glycerol-3-phosphate dehydrogenase